MNLPTLPGCGQPATIRIEIYSPADGRLRGSLDAAAYACDAHGIEMVSAAYAAGMTAHRVPLAPDIERPCGKVHVYPTGTLADDAPVNDESCPRWCDRRDCRRRGEHRSPARGVDTGQPEAVIVDVSLVQNVHPAAEPQISLTGIDGARAAEPVAVHLVLSIGQARTLRYRLAQLLDAAKGGRR